MSAEPRYYYVDAQNQAAGPIALAGLLALQATGTVTDATLVVVEGGTEWAAFSTLKPSAGTLAPTATSPTPDSLSTVAGSPSSSSSSEAEPLWASQLTQKIDQLAAAMDKLISALEKARPATAGLSMPPATAALHAEKSSFNPVPKPGIATQISSSAPSTVPRTAPLPAGVAVVASKPTGLPASLPRPGVATPLTPLAVPANAQKSALPLPALGKAPGANLAGIPKPAAPAPAATPTKGNIFSKFLKK